MFYWTWQQKGVTRFSSPIMVVRQPLKFAQWREESCFVIYKAFAGFSSSIQTKTKWLDADLIGKGNSDNNEDRKRHTICTHMTVKC